MIFDRYACCPGADKAGLVQRARAAVATRTSSAAAATATASQVHHRPRDDGKQTILHCVRGCCLAMAGIGHYEAAQADP
jgi:hypothetical protein